MPTLTPDEEATKLLRKWAAREAALSGRKVTEVMREAGILTDHQRQSIHEFEIPLSNLRNHVRGALNRDLLGNDNLGDEYWDEDSA